MKFKLDENLDERLVLLLRNARHDAVTVRDEELRGISDTKLVERCRIEERILISLDKDFSNTLRFPPEETPGLVVLRGHNNLFATMRTLIRSLLQALDQDQPDGRLWIIEPGRLRIHESGSQIDADDVDD